MKTIKEVLALLGVVLIAWVLLALIEAIPQATRMFGKSSRQKLEASR